MKSKVFNVMNASLFFLFMTGIPAAIAGGGIKIRLLNDEISAAVLFSSVEPTEFGLSIENQSETTVYYTESRKKLKEYKKVFNFSQLEDGHYYLIAKAGDEKVVKSFTIRDSKLFFETEIDENLVKIQPFFRLEGDILYCYLNNRESGEVSIHFADDRSIFYTDEVTSTKNVRKKYDLSQLPSGEYTIIVSTDSESYSHPIQLK